VADKWLTFDCYGTVADWNTGMGGALAELAGVSGADARRLLGAYHRAELEIEAGPGWRPYREVLTAGLARAAAREEVTLPDGGPDGAALRVGGPRPHRAPGQAGGPADHQHAQAAGGGQRRERHLA